MARQAKPRRAIVHFRGIEYEMNMVVLRLALVHRQVDGDFDSMEQLADAIGVSRSTVCRFFAGRATSLTIAMAVLKKLKLKFEEVFTPINFEPA